MNEVINLNLSPRYVPNWGAWEVCREILCNAIDAAENDMECRVEGSDTLIVTTPTVPDMHELFIIGEGSKAVGGNTIGQFGEGLKIAALAACRAPGGSLELLVPGQQIRFGFQQIFGKDVLHAFIKPSDHKSGFQAKVTMHGCSFAFAGRLLPDRTPRPMEKSCGSGFKLYVKGVFVTEFGNKAIWDWNLGNVRMNRDRSLVLEKDVAESIGIFLSESIDLDIAKAIVQSGDSFEAGNGLSNIWQNHKVSSTLAAAFRELHGDKAMIAELWDDAANARATNAGFTVVKDLSPSVRYAIRQHGVKDASSIVVKWEPESVDPAPYKEQVAKLQELDTLISAPSVTVCIYANRSEAHKGQASLEDNRLWLSEGLFTPGNELELVRTYLHEMAHHMSQAEDVTARFENALDGIAGRLAMRLLNSNVPA